MCMATVQAAVTDEVCVWGGGLPVCSVHMQQQAMGKGTWDFFINHHEPDVCPIKHEPLTTHSQHICIFPNARVLHDSLATPFEVIRRGIAQRHLDTPYQPSPHRTWRHTRSLMTQLLWGLTVGWVQVLPPAFRGRVRFLLSRVRLNVPGSGGGSCRAIMQPAVSRTLISSNRCTACALLNAPVAAETNAFVLGLRACSSSTASPPCSAAGGHVAEGERCNRKLFYISIDASVRSHPLAAWHAAWGRCKGQCSRSLLL
jgi:hypothetical protein